jgi:hypothetical protein
MLSVIAFHFLLVIDGGTEQNYINSVMNADSLYHKRTLETRAKVRVFFFSGSAVHFEQGLL